MNLLFKLGVFTRLCSHASLIICAVFLQLLYLWLLRVYSILNLSNFMQKSFKSPIYAFLAIMSETKLFRQAPNGVPVCSVTSDRASLCTSFHRACKQTVSHPNGAPCAAQGGDSA